MLPFKKGLKIAVLGPHGNATKEMVGNYLGQLCPGPADSGIGVGTNPSGDGGFSCVDSPLAAITKANTGGTTIFSQGCEIDGTDKSKFATALAAAKSADVVVLGLGIVQAIEAESHDRTEIDLPAIQHEFAAAVEALGKPTAIFLFHGGCAIKPVSATRCLVSVMPCTLFAETERDDQDGRIGARAGVVRSNCRHGLSRHVRREIRIVLIFCPVFLTSLFPTYTGFQGGHALASVLFGDYNPGGKLPCVVRQPFPAAAFVFAVAYSN